MLLFIVIFTLGGLGVGMFLAIPIDEKVLFPIAHKIVGPLDNWDVNYRRLYILTWPLAVIVRYTLLLPALGWINFIYWLVVNRVRRIKKLFAKN